jgi:hypothetical protein
MTGPKAEIGNLIADALTVIRLTPPGEEPCWQDVRLLLARAIYETRLLIEEQRIRGGHHERLDSPNSQGGQGCPRCG